jgi:hypothetical protein
MNTPTSLFDLTVSQAEEIELAVGKSIDDWDEVASMADLYARILSAVQGKSLEEIKALPLREVLSGVVAAGKPDPNIKRATGPKK